MKIHMLWIAMQFIFTAMCLETITIGTSMSAASTIPFMKQFGISAKKAFALFDTFLEQQNNTVVVGANGDNPGIAYEWKWRIEEDEGNFTKMMANMKKMCEDPEVQFVVPTSFSNFAIPASDHCDKLIVSPSYLPRPFYDNHTNLFQVIPPAENWLDVVLPNLRYSDLTRLGIIHGTLDFYEALCNGITSDKAKHVGVDVVSRQEYTLSESDTLGNVTELESALDALMNKNAQVLFYCGLPPGGKHILEYLNKRKYHFGSIVFVPWRDDYLTMPSYLIDYLMVPIISHVDMRSDPDDYFKSHEVFYKTYANFSEDKTPAHITSMFNFYVPVVIKDALERSKSIDKADLRESLLRTSLVTLMGTIEYDGAQRPKMLTSVLQRLNDSWNVVWPPYVSSTPIVMDSPPWRDRVYDGSIRTVEWVFIVIASILIFFTLCIMAAIFKWRDEQIINASMPLFLLMIGVGCVLIYASIIVWLNHQLTVVTCILRVWMLNIGFALLFGTMFSKNYAVLKVWTSNLTKKSRVTQKSTLLIVLVIVTVHIILLLVYTIAGDVDVERKPMVTNPHRPYYDQEYCTNNSTGSVMLILMACWGLLLILLKMIIGWRTRKIVFLAYNESRILLFTTYNVALFSIILLFIVVNEDRIDAEVLFILRSTCLILGVLFTELILYGNKIWLFFNKKTNRSKKSTLNEPYNTNTPQPGQSSHTTSSMDETLGETRGVKSGDKVTITKEQYKEYKRLKKVFKSAEVVSCK